jgi:hypothetical protein
MNAKLIHPVEVEIQNTDTNNTQINTILDEHVGDIQYKSKFSIQAQVKFNNSENVQNFANGFQLAGDGYLLAYKSDADKIDINAKIVSIEGIPYEFYVEGKKLTSAYDNSKFVKIMFVSKDGGAT